MLKLAIPNKGALSEDAVRLLGEAGYKCSRSGRELVVSDRVNDIDFVFLRPRDIALYVGDGVLDLGITGRDLKEDSGADVIELFPLGFGRSRFCFAVPKESGLTVEKLGGLRIATSYPELLRRNLEKRNLKCPIVRLDGAGRDFDPPRRGGCDRRRSRIRATLTEAGLVVTGEPMLCSEAVLIGRSPELQECHEVKKLIARLRGHHRRRQLCDDGVRHSALGARGGLFDHSRNRVADRRAAVESGLGRRQVDGAPQGVQPDHGRAL